MQSCDILVCCLAYELLIKICIGPLIKLTARNRDLFQLVHLIYVRKPLTLTTNLLIPILLARFEKQKYPKYTMCRSPDVFPSRDELIKYHDALVCLETMYVHFEEKAYEKVASLGKAAIPLWMMVLSNSAIKQSSAIRQSRESYLKSLEAGKSRKSGKKPMQT